MSAITPAIRPAIGPAIRSAFEATLRRAWSPTSLFSASEPGAWYDPSDMSSLFQDSAGTTPVTAVEQPVGMMLDKSGRGNHAIQATTTKRPIYSRRVNLLTKTEQFDDAVWVNGNSTVSANAITAPDGTLTGDKLIENVGASGNKQVSTTATLAASTIYRMRVAVKPDSRNSVYVAAGSTSPWGATGSQRGVYVNCTTGTVFLSEEGATATATIVAGGWVLIDVTFPVTTTGGGCFPLVRLCTDAGGFAYTGDGSGLYIWGASLTLATDAHLPYQRVNTATDYDADPAKFPAFRRLDGVDDSLACGTGGGGAAGFFFSSVVSPWGSAGTNRTLFSDAGTNTGYIVRLNTSNQLELSAGNGAARTSIATTSTLAVGASDVVQAWDDGVNLNVKIGTGPTASIARPAVVAGTAGYTLGQNNGASSGYFNGRIYGEIYRKDSAPTQAQHAAVARYQRQKARLP